MKVRLFAIVAFLVALVISSARPIAGARVKPENYAYGSLAFTSFVADSYRIKGSGSAQEFYKWFNARFAKAVGNDPKTYLSRAKKRIRSLNGKNERLEEEVDLARAIHSAIREVLPNFSLVRGFEFYQAKERGERQCLLQSILVSGLLQQAGLESGVAMVYKKAAGKSTNNGHNVALLRLSDDSDILVDCSGPEPFVHHKGLFVRTSADEYAYVKPQYKGDRILGYRHESSNANLSNRSVAGLDIPFIRSMFSYYRGERAPGGFYGTPPTAKGLGESVTFLQRSIREHPRNPLAVYMLGNVYRKQGRKEDAAGQYVVALNLYQEYGWVPPGVLEALSS